MRGFIIASIERAVDSRGFIRDSFLFAISVHKIVYKCTIRDIYKPHWLVMPWLPHTMSNIPTSDQSEFRSRRAFATRPREINCSRCHDDIFVEKDKLNLNPTFRLHHRKIATLSCLLMFRPIDISKRLALNGRNSFQFASIDARQMREMDLVSYLWCEMSRSDHFLPQCNDRLFEIFSDYAADVSSLRT
jgi:hypothetical protein